MAEDKIETQPKWPWDKPEKPNWKWWIPWDINENISHKASITFTQDAILSDQVYSSDNDEEHAVMVTRWTVTISNTTITKTWNAEWDTSDFYW